MAELVQLQTRNQKIWIQSASKFGLVVNIFDLFDRRINSQLRENSNEVDFSRSEGS